MGWRCHGCASLRQDVACSGPLQCARQRRLCQLFDKTLIEHCPGLTVEQYIELNRWLEIDYAAALFQAASEELPRNAAGFSDLLERSHARVFLRAVPAIAGCFRRREVYFGRYPHEFQGCAWEKIGDELSALFARCGFETLDLSAVSRAAFVLKVAFFLERFFMIHPFADGNGRVARLFTSMLCNHTGRWSFIATRSEGNHSQRRKYDRALTYAHEALGQGQRSIFNPRHAPYHLLERWIDGRLTERVRDSDLVEEPPPPDRKSSRPPSQ